MTAHQSIPWHQIETVLLDMDGTLLDLHFDHYFWTEHLPQHYAAHHQVSLSQAKTRLGQLIRQAEGSLQWYCLDYWSQQVSLPVAALKHEVAHKIQTRPHTMAFLQFLQAEGKRVLLITNAHRASLQLKLACTDIAPYFAAIISSHDYGAPKESQAFWQALAAQEHFNPAHTLFVDDTPRILAAAATFGIGHLLCITQPDSQQPPNPPSAFLNAQDFHQVMPPHAHA